MDFRPILGQAPDINISISGSNIVEKVGPESGYMTKIKISWDLT